VLKPEKAVMIYKKDAIYKTTSKKPSMFVEYFILKSFGPMKLYFK